jgi:hypothetical protein
MLVAGQPARRRSLKLRGEYIGLVLGEAEHHVHSPQCQHIKGDVGPHLEHFKFGNVNTAAKCRCRCPAALNTFGGEGAHLQVPPRIQVAYTPQSPLTILSAHPFV